MAAVMQMEAPRRNEAGYTRPAEGLSEHLRKNAIDPAQALMPLALIVGAVCALRLLTVHLLLAQRCHVNLATLFSETTAADSAADRQAAPLMSPSCRRPSHS